LLKKAIMKIIKDRKGFQKMKNFAKGFIIGGFSVVGAAAAVLYTFHKVIVQPIEDQENRATENRKRAMRKQHSAHNG